MARRPAMAGLLAIALVGLGLRVLGLAHESFWIDEIASLQLAQDGFSEGFGRVRSDVHPPGYFVLLRLWIALFGASESAVRWLSVVPSVLTIAALYRLGARLAGPGTRSGVRVGLMAAAIAATSLSQIYYAQEGRSYAWLMCLTTLSMDALVGIVTRGRASDWTRYTLLSAAMLYTHYFAFFALAAQNAFILYRWRSSAAAARPSPVHWLVAQAAIAGAFLPWLPSLLTQMGTVRDGFWIREASVAGLGTAFLRFASLDGPWATDGPPAYFAWLGPLVAAAVVAVAVGGAALAALAARERRSGSGQSDLREFDARLLVGTWLLLPPLAGWSLSLFGLDVFTYRNTMISAPAFVLALALACDKAPGTTWRSAALTLILAPSLVQAPSYYSQPHKDQWREAARQVEGDFAPETDGIAFDAPFVRGSFLHYAPDLASAIGSGQGIDLLADAPPDHRRIWLVRAYAGPRSRSPGRIRGWGFERVARSDWVSIEVFLFERNSSAQTPQR